MNDYNIENTKWEKWFAWYPVRTVTKKRVWLDIIYRREEQYYDYTWGGTYRTGYVYAELMDILRYSL